MSGFWTDGQNDRDWHTETHGPDEHRGQHQRQVPCESCRAPVWVDARTWSLFDTPLCDACKRRPLPAVERA